VLLDVLLSPLLRLKEVATKRAFIVAGARVFCLDVPLHIVEVISVARISACDTFQVAVRHQINQTSLYVFS
jgi:hypothetical protein